MSCALVVHCPQVDSSEGAVAAGDLVEPVVVAAGGAVGDFDPVAVALGFLPQAVFVVQDWGAAVPQRFDPLDDHLAVAGGELSPAGLVRGRDWLGYSERLV